MEIKIKSDDFSRGETTSGFVYGAFNVAAPNLLESANAFRYETQSGFVVETRNNVLPFFNVDDRSLYWHDFTVAPPVASLAEFYSFPIRQEQFQAVGFNPEQNFVAVTTVYGDGASTVHLGASAYASSDPAACWGSPYAVVVGTVVDDQIQLVSQCFGKHENCFVGHQEQSGPLMAGKQYLVPQCERERTEATAKDHVLHLEFLTLSRNHSNPTLLSTVVRELKGLGRTWRTYFNSSGSRSSFWPGSTLSLHLCLFLDVSFSRSI